MLPITTIARARKELTYIQRTIHKTACDKGWYDEDLSELSRWGRFAANVHREVSEMWDAYVKGNPPSEKIPAHSSIEEELADVIIRILDTAENEDLDVIGAIFAKMEFNEGRPYRHGGKKA